MTISLRPITRDDAADPVIVDWHTDPAGYALMYEQPSTPQQARAMIETWAGRWEANGFGYWIAEQDGQPVGIGGVQRLSFEGTDYLNLYYRVDPAARGQGVALRIARAGTAYAAEHQPDLRVLARVAPANTPSLATVARAGMLEVGPFRAPNDPAEKPAPISWESPVVRRGAPDAAGREEMLDLWCRVNDTGGAVGFEAGAARDRVAAKLDEALADASRELVRLLAPTADTWADPTRAGALLGFGFVLRGEGRVVAHRRWLLAVMTDPDLRGRGLGGVLLGALHACARGLCRDRPSP